MDAPFFEEWQDRLFPDSPALISACTFHPERYTDALFSHFQIPFAEPLGSAVACRRAEYLAGRYLAQKNLNACGFALFSLHADSDFGPRWPPGVSGSISHSRNTALCAVLPAPSEHQIGIDIEPVLSEADARSLWPHLIQPAEYHHYRSLPFDFPFLLTLIFSARESLFKALAQRGGKNAALPAFAATLVAVDENRVTLGYRNKSLSVDYRLIDNQVITLVKIPGGGSNTL